MADYTLKMADDHHAKMSESLSIMKKMMVKMMVLESVKLIVMVYV